MTESPEAPPHAELERLLTDVSELATSFSVEQAMADADVFIDGVAELRARAAHWLHEIEPAELERRLVEYANRRVGMVDDPDEYARAADELVTASLVLADAPDAAAAALKRAVMLFSAVLSEPGTPRVFGRLLRRLREIARQSGSVDLRAWVDGAIGSLPD